MDFLRTIYPVGVKVTLRSQAMYEFLERLITIALPRIRDFRGLKASGFDGQGNYNFGITEQIIFPEIEYDKVTDVRGMDIIVTTNIITKRRRAKDEGTKGTDGRQRQRCVG